MTLRSSESGSWLARLLAQADDDPGCEATFRALDAYVDAVLRGDDPADRYASVLLHLRDCPACDEDARGLLAAIHEIDRSGSNPPPGWPRR